MNRTTALLLLLPSLAACDIGPIFPDLEFDWDDLWTEPPPTTVMVSGTVLVGPYLTMEGEVSVELVDPASPSIPVAVVAASSGSYVINLGASPNQRVCSFQVRAVLWSGEISSLEPLFATTPSSCVLAPGWFHGAALRLAYEPLVEPFVIEGNVFIDGRPARAQEATITPALRWGSSPDSTRTTRTDAEGHYRIETLAATERFAWCSYLSARVSDTSGRSEDIQLNALPPSSCGNERALPDARIGTLKAVAGQLYRNDWNADRYLGAGEAWAELIRMEDGAVGERFATLDDGSFHVWFPQEERDPGCGWVLRVTLATGPSDVREVFQEGGACQGPAYHYMSAATFSTPFGSPLALTVADPVGDNTGLTDLTRMTLGFDPQTGIYEIELVADAAQPFQGEFRVNINLFNPARVSTFRDNVNDFAFDTPTTTLTLNGFARELRSWLPGDSVHTNSLRGTPNPPGTTLFRSGVGHFPMGFLTNEDVIAFADLATPAVVVAAGP